MVSRTECVPVESPRGGDCPAKVKVTYSSMAAATCCARAANINFIKNLLQVPCRWSNTLSHHVVERHRKSKLSHMKEKETPEQTSAMAPPDFRFVYPEFLPNPLWHKRDRICEMLERRDMYKRRAVLPIPEFYVGSIMAVSVSDPYAPGKRNRFVGICIQRGGHGLRGCFTLRNVIDGQGLEICYELYNPNVQKIEVLKLEKRLDDDLTYLRDAPAEYSTVPFDLEPVAHPPGAQIPVNQVKVRLGPRPWLERWERRDLKGVEPLGLAERFYRRAREVAKPWEQHDLMKQYRGSINGDEAGQILGEVQREVAKTQASKRTPPDGSKDS